MKRQDKIFRIGVVGGKEEFEKVNSFFKLLYEDAEIISYSNEETALKYKYLELDILVLANNGLHKKVMKSIYNYVKNSNTVNLNVLFGDAMYEHLDDCGFSYLKNVNYVDEKYLMDISYYDTYEDTRRYSQLSVVRQGRNMLIPTNIPNVIAIGYNSVPQCMEYKTSSNGKEVDLPSNFVESAILYSPHDYIMGNPTLYFQNLIYRDFEEVTKENRSAVTTMRNLFINALNKTITVK